MGLFTGNPYYDIEHTASFIEDDVRPGWIRVYSTDPRFPISVAHPRNLGPFLDRNRRGWLKLELGNDVVIDREDLREAAEGGDARAAMVLVRPGLGRERLVAQLERQVGRQVFLGLQPSARSDVQFRVTITTRMVFEGRDAVAGFTIAPEDRTDDWTLGFVVDEGLWAVSRRISSSLPSDVLAAIVDSMRWLGATAQRRIAAQQIARAVAMGAGRSPNAVLNERIASRMASCREHPLEPRTFLGVTVTFDPEDLPGKPPNWPTSGHFRVRRSDEVEPALFGSEQLAASQVLEEARRQRLQPWTVDDALYESLAM